MAEFKPTLEDRVKLADQLIGYFQRLLNSGHSFGLGLDVAKQWRKYLLQEQHDLDELRMFASALEDGVDKHGCGWYELTLSVKWWLAELEENRKAS